MQHCVTNIHDNYTQNSSVYKLPFCERIVTFFVWGIIKSGNLKMCIMRWFLGMTLDGVGGFVAVNQFYRHKNTHTSVILEEG